MRILKRFARFIVELILAVSIIVFLLVYLLETTVLNERYVLSCLEESDYYSKIYELLESNFENYIQQSGLDENILENIVTKEDIEKDTEKIIVNIYDGISEELSTDKIRANLSKNINKSIKNQELNDEEQKAIDNFIEEICKEYKNIISNSEYEGQINQGYTQIVKYLKIIKKVSVISIGISIVILIVLNLRRNYKIFTNLGISSLASGIILIAVNIYINVKIKIKYIAILNEAISVVIRNIASDILSNILLYGMVLSVAGVSIVILSNLLHNIYKYKYILEDETRED